MRVIFINYGSFESNSGGHIYNFASRIARLGHTVAICAQGEPPSISRDTTNIYCFSHETIYHSPRLILDCGNVSDVSQRTIIHAWTPRDKVVSLTAKLAELRRLEYFVHLEDNEELISAANLGIAAEEFMTLSDGFLPSPYPDSLSHPRRYVDFLRNAVGVTIIVPPLARFVPPGLPTHLLEPGVDVDAFSSPLTKERRRSIKREICVDEASSVCVYHGNMHRANEREIFSLYVAFLILRRRGHNVALVRTGRDFTDGLDVSFSHLNKAGVVNLGFVESGFLRDLLKISDFFIQPGSSNDFNDFRFPSKIPEFLATGRPTILPNANVGLRLRDGEQALLLRCGEGIEIVEKTESLIANPRLADQIGANGQLFARSNLDWDRNAANLMRFYATNERRKGGTDCV